MKGEKDRLINTLSNFLKEKVTISEKELRATLNLAINRHDQRENDLFIKNLIK